MKYSQSRFQSIIYRLRGIAYQLIALSLVLLAASYFGGYLNNENIQIYLVGIIAIPTLFTLWLMLFNSGKTRIDEYAIEFTDNEICYHHLAELESISLENYQGYKISGLFNKHLTINGTDNCISFNLGIFNKSQTKSIINHLSSKC